MDGLTDWLEKQSKRRQQVGKRNNQQNELVQLIKQEAHSVKHYQQSQQVGLAADICGQAVVQGWGANTLLQREQQVDVWAVVSCVSAKASTSLPWSVINETVSGLHRSPPSSLPPGWPCNAGSKRRPSRYRHVSTRRGHYGVNSGKVSMMRRDDSTLMLRFINV